jgi:hypothetical protein
MVRVLAVADEVVDGLLCGLAEQIAPDLVLGAGDLPFDYLETLATRSDAPCVYVPGNHDRDLSGFRRGRSGWTRAGLPATDPGPRGAVNADGRVVSVAGLRIAGLGGSIRYNGGPNQYREQAQRRRAKALHRREAMAARIHRLRGRHPARVDILLTHSPAQGYGDETDAPHRGFACLIGLVRALRPQALVHGHVHPYGTRPQDLRIPFADTPSGSDGAAVSVNTVGYTVFDITPGGEGIAITRRRHGA